MLGPFNPRNLRWIAQPYLLLHLIVGYHQSCPNLVPVRGTKRKTHSEVAKKTSDLIPLCHPLALTRVAIDFEAAQADVSRAGAIICTATVETVGPTGVEMEALTAVNVALLTIYDMCKAVDRAMVMTGIKLLEKHGGKSGSFVAGG